MKIKLRFLLILLLVSSLLTSVLFISAGSPGDTMTMYDQHETSEDDDDETEEEDETSTEEEDDDDETDDEEEDDEDDEEDLRTAYEREVEIEQDNREFKVESELKNGENKDEFQAEFKVGGGDEPELKFEYSTESNDTETELSYRIEFNFIYEFEENSSIVSYDENDTLISSYELDKADWEDIVYEERIVNGTTIYVATASTSDGVFTLVLSLAGSFAELNGSLLTPNSIKVDVEIHNYPFESDNSYLALETDVKTESETEVEDDTVEEQAGFTSQEQQVSISSQNANGFFSWIETAMADGQQVDVIASDLILDSEDDGDVEEGEIKGLLYFTFDAITPTDLIWDPKVGVVSQASLELLSSLQAADGSLLEGLPGFEFISLLSIIAIAGIISRRKFRRD